MPPRIKRHVNHSVHVACTVECREEVVDAEGVPIGEWDVLSGLVPGTQWLTSPNFNQQPPSASGTEAVDAKQILIISWGSLSPQVVLFFECCAKCIAVPGCPQLESLRVRDGDGGEGRVSETASNGGRIPYD